MRKREIPEPKRLVADVTEEMHSMIKVHCAKKNINKKDFIIAAVLEKYEREKDV